MFGVLLLIFWLCMKVVLKNECFKRDSMRIPFMSNYIPYCPIHNMIRLPLII